MNTALVLLTLASYLIGGAHLIRWAARKSDQETPSYVNSIGALFWIPICTRVVGWLIPDAWAWPDRVIGGGVGAIVFFVMLRISFKIDVKYAVVVFVCVYLLAILTAWSMIPLVDAAKAAK